MGLALCAFLVAVGLWIQSALFVAWVVLLVTPAWLLFVKIFEERELELRFGEAYREYRAGTPMFFPGPARRR
jgi:protein-S-isoprenylcysteine O-methyltransferase Ste14